MASENASLCGLPDELLLEILQYFKVIPSYEIQWRHFNYGTSFHLTEREHENRERQLQLYNLCLVCKHVRRIATPVLYSSFVGVANWLGIDTLILFHRTLMEHNVLAGQQFNHVDYLQYVENRVCDNRDCVGANAHADADENDPDSAQMLAQYFYLLADTVSKAANIQHLSVASFENHEITFWGHILPGHHDVTVLARHAFRKLQTLHVRLNKLNIPDGITQPVSFYDISSAMTSVPLLSNLRASGYMSYDMPPGRASRGSYRCLQRLEIIETPAHFSTVRNIVLSCKGLRHIVCSWFLDHNEPETPSNFYPALLSQLNTLETLHLDFREVYYTDDFMQSQCLGSLRPFTRLKRLAISESGFLGAPSPFLVPDNSLSPRRIADLLPSGLETFTLLLDVEKRIRWEECIDDWVLIWDLVAACKSFTVRLKEVTIKSHKALLEAPLLTAAFSQIGVRFHVIEDDQY